MNVHGFLNVLKEELLIEDPAAYKNFLQMSNASFEKLFELVHNKIGKQGTQFRESIPSVSFTKA